MITFHNGIHVNVIYRRYLRAPSFRRAYCWVNLPL